MGDSHGGVCVYVNKNFVSKRNTDTECVWIELLLRNKKLLIGTFYRPPNSSPAVLSSIEDAGLRSAIGRAPDS